VGTKTHDLNQSVSGVRRTPELRLLLSTATCHLSEGGSEAIDHLLQQDLDWQHLLELAAWHRLAALLGAHLSSKRYANKVPAEILGRLLAFRDRCQARYQALRQELEKILRTLDSEGIPVIVLKGAALAESIYPEAALRPMRDLDLMVEEEHLDRAVAAVQSFGYSSPASSAVQQRTEDSHRHYPELWSRDGKTCLELHRHIVRPTGPLQFDISGFWSRAQEAEIAGARALVLTPEDLLLHLCLKFFADTRGEYPSYRALGKLVDISETLNHYRDVMRWDQFVQRILEARFSGPVGCALLTTRELLLNGPSEDLLVRLAHEETTAQNFSPFITRKVLRPPKSRWYFHQLIDPPDPTGTTREMMSALRRMVSSRVALETRYGPKPLSHLWLNHGAEVLGALSEAVARPQDFCQDLKIDRWLCSLMKRSRQQIL